MSPSFWRLDVVSVTPHILDFAQRNNFGLRSKQDLVSSHNMVTTTVWGFINSRIIAVAIGVSMQLHAYNHLLSRCSRENSGIRYHQPIKSKGGVLLVKSRFRTLRGDRVRSHFPLEEVFQNAQLNSCTRELTGRICKRDNFCRVEVENFCFSGGPGQNPDFTEFAISPISLISPLTHFTEFTISEIS